MLFASNNSRISFSAQKLKSNKEKSLSLSYQAYAKAVHAVDLAKLKTFYDEFKPNRVGVMGAAGRSVLNKLGLKADIEFGISRSAAIAASRGLNVFVLTVGRIVNRIIQEIDEINMKTSAEIIYEVKNAQIS